jgi:predicted membrane-bound spermidine synthase
VPSFGIWGYALAKMQPFAAPREPPENIELKFLTANSFASMFEFSKGHFAAKRGNRDQSSRQPSARPLLRIGMAQI